MHVPYAGDRDRSGRDSRWRPRSGPRAAFRVAETTGRLWKSRVFFVACRRQMLPPSSAFLSFMEASEFVVQVIGHSGVSHLIRQRNHSSKCSRRLQNSLTPATGGCSWIRVRHTLCEGRRYPGHADPEVDCPLQEPPHSKSCRHPLPRHEGVPFVSWRRPLTHRHEGSSSLRSGRTPDKRRARLQGAFRLPKPGVPEENGD